MSLALLVMSDIHTEFHRDGGRSFIQSLDPAGVDAIVVAGDLTTPSHLEAAFDLLCDRFPAVVYVAGNHEFYQSSPAKTAETLARCAARHENLHWLDERVVEIAGQRFVGTTLWFPDDAAALPFRRVLNDFRLIRDFVPWVFEKCARARAFLEENVRPGDVVVTHHLPSLRSVHSIYADSPLNAFFVCDVEPLITERKPALWIHGHTHERVDYTLGPTHVVANPFGYLGKESQANFDEHLILRVSKL
jgi:predicted phosphodiesterase